MRTLYKNETLLLFVIICIDLLFLLYGINSLSISASEAYIYFNSHSLVHYIIKLSTLLFGQNEYGLRLPFVFFHVISIFLVYKIGKMYLKRKFDRIFSVIIYLLLPGINSAALAVNEAGIVIFLTLLFIYLYENRKRYLSYAILFLSLFVDNSFSILYLGLIFYSLFKKDNTLLYITLFLFGASMYIWSFDTGGKPKNYFIETLAVYSAIFSPLVFLYFFYTEYRILVKEKKDILWFISFVAFVFSLLLSFRQRIRLEDFAPFAVIATPLMVRTFLSSYRVRIPELRSWHKFFFTIVMLSLVLNFFAIYFNKALYLFLSDPQKHFAYKYDFAKEVAKKLKKMNIGAIYTDDEDLRLRLKFYGIKSEKNGYILSKTKLKNSKSVTISYFNKPIFRIYVSKLHR